MVPKNKPPNKTSKPQSASRRLTVSLQLASLMFLTGCGTQGGSCELIALKQYDEFFKAGLAYEVSQMNEASPTFIFIRDGIQLRDQVRACKE